jgi:taurine dioxygenase
MLTVKPLDEKVDFGVRIAGVTLQALREDGTRNQISDLFEQSGVIIFEDVETTGEMHVALSNVFGPLKEHPSPAVKRAQGDLYPGIVENTHLPDEQGICEVDGQRLSMSGYSGRGW